MAAKRKTPTASNGGSDVGTTYADLVDAEIGALWKCVPTKLTIGGTANVLTGTSDAALVSAIPTTAAPMSFWLIPILDNTGAVTINVDGLGALPVKDGDGAALVAGALKTGRQYLIVYDSGATQWRALGVVSATVTTPSVAPGMIIRDEKATNTAGGTATSGSYATRTLNTAVRNVIAGASLASNSFTLPAGTFLIEWSAPAYYVGAHISRLWNATDSAEAEIGTSEYSATGGAFGIQSRTFGSAVVTLSTPKAFTIEHKVATTVTTSGLGFASNLGSKEVYAWVNIWKVA